LKIRKLLACKRRESLITEIIFLNVKFKIKNEHLSILRCLPIKYLFLFSHFSLPDNNNNVTADVGNIPFFFGTSPSYETLHHPSFYQIHFWHNTHKNYYYSNIKHNPLQMNIEYSSGTYKSNFNQFVMAFCWRHETHTHTHTRSTLATYRFQKISFLSCCNDDDEKGVLWPQFEHQRTQTLTSANDGVVHWWW
jgi:hypothetical protein